MSVSNKDSLFPELKAELCPEVTEVESLCMQCGKNGITKLLLTKIPFYREVVVMSFSCEHCHWKNNELQPAATIQEKGIQFKLLLNSTKDLGRQIVKTRYASIAIPELHFELPAGTQEGTVTTIEGILQRAYDGISMKQQELEVRDPESSEKLVKFLKDFQDLKDCKVPFHLILRDISGNSFLENLSAPEIDPNMEIIYFERSRQEALTLGIVADDGEEENEEFTAEDIKNEVMEFQTNCPNCNAPCTTNMKLTQIPLFKDVVIMSTSCDACGHKTNEVKSGGGIEDYGVKYILQLNSEKDFARDLLKSDTCYVHIPELEFEIGPSAVKGCYTTVEGLVTNIKKQLIEDNPFVTGDSAPPKLKEKMKNFLKQLDSILNGTLKCTLILDDPCGSSYLQSYDSTDSENNFLMNKYERTFEQNEELGLNDMKVENYEET